MAALASAAVGKWIVFPVLVKDNQSSTARVSKFEVNPVRKIPINTSDNQSEVVSDFNQRNLQKSYVHSVIFAQDDFPLAIASETASKSDTFNPIYSVQQLLANQGIVIPGIDENSSHADALFAVYFSDSGTISDQAIEIILGDWARINPAAAWQWIESNDTTEILHQYRATIVQHWLEQDADAALLAVTSLQWSNDKDELLADYASFIAIEEPDRAFYWAYGLADDRSRRRVLDRVIYDWASADPEQVILHLNSIAEPEIRQQMLIQAGPAITAKLIQTNAQQALLWINSLGEHEQQFLSPIAFQQWVNKNPVEAMNWLTAQSDNPDNELYMSSVATTLAYQNLPVAMQVFPTMTIAIQENMAPSIAYSLYQVNSDDAKIWSNNLSSLSVQRSAHRGTLKASVDAEPEFALQMALEYTGNDQNQVLVDTAIEVDQQHPGLIEIWLTNAPVNEAQRQVIREALVRSPPD